MGLFTKALKRSNAEKSGEDSDTPVWLKMLQDNSWELEILISGGAIFSLFELSGLTTEFFYQLSYTNHFPGRNLVFMGVMLAIKGITIGFFAHIIVRSFWVSLVALSSMFGDQSTQKEISLQKPFKHKPKSLVDLIIQVNKLSAWMMYNSFASAIMILGLMLLFLAFVLLRVPLAAIHFPYADDVLAVIVILYLGDLVLFSLLRKIPYVSYAVYPFFKLMDMISLRFIYQRGIEYIAQNIARWKVAIYYFIFILVSVLFTYLSIFRIMHWPNIFDDRQYRFTLTEYEEHYSEFLYRNKTETGKSHVASIQSDIISEPVLNVFINYSVVYDQFINQIPDPNKRYFENIWQLSVDDSVYNDLQFYTIHGNNSSTMGITTYVDVGRFKQGPHVLSITNLYETENSRRKKLNIPFWLDKEQDQ